MIPWGVTVSLILILVIVGPLWPEVKQFFRWLKGSRTSYYLEGPDDARNAKMASMPNRFKTIGLYHDSVIEINRGFWRRRSAIYGPAAKNWKIVGIFRIMMDVDCVELQGGLNLPVNKTLQLINTYSSLRAMLDRIAKQEKRIADLDKEYKVIVDGIVALRARIIVERQRFRSPAVQKIRECLEMILGEVDKECFVQADPEAWERRFMGQRPENAPVK